MSHAKTLGFMAILVFLAGCMAPVEPGAAAAALEGEVVLTFDAAWSESASGPLREGASVRVEYDPARTPCTGERYGQPAYSVFAHWRIDGGAVSTLQVAGFESYPGAIDPTFVVPAAGDLELWFEASDVWGCHEWDSSFGANYHFTVDERDASAPDWMGNPAYVIDRQTCNAGPCDGSRRSLEDGFVYDTYARQRAALRAAYFDVWKPGVTDFDNPDLWRQLDARAYVSFDGGNTWSWEYVDFVGRVGNDARYELDLRHLDPLGGGTITDPATQCPTIPLETTGTGYVRARMQLYFVVNGVVLSRADGSYFEGLYEDYEGLYAPCL